MASYYIRQGTFAPQGPFEEARIAGYIAQGKVRAGMEISADGQRWMPVEEHRLFAAAPPVRAVATPPPVRAVQSVEEVEVVEEISAAPAVRTERRPARRPRPVPTSGGGGKVVVAVVGLLVVGGIAVMASKGGSKDPASPPVTPTATSTSGIVSADDLSAEYGVNEIAADTKYKGRTVTVSGEVIQVGKDSTIGTPFLILATRRWPRVWCYLDGRAAERATSFRGGERVGILGVCRGLQYFKTDDGERQYVLIEDTLAQSAVDPASRGAPSARESKEAFRARWERVHQVPDGKVFTALKGMIWLTDAAAAKAKIESVSGRKPDRTQTIGGRNYWYFECADGLIQLVWWQDGIFNYTVNDY